MEKIRVTKIFKFEAAHALPNHNGNCKHLHGHSYELKVTLIGTPKKQEGSDEGMVMDFGDLKKIVKKHVIDVFDHSLILKQGDLSGSSARQVILNVSPTCENLLIEIKNKIKDDLPLNVELKRVKLKETDSSYAEWHADDN